MNLIFIWKEEHEDSLWGSRKKEIRKWLVDITIIVASPWTYQPPAHIGRNRQSRKSRLAFPPLFGPSSSLPSCRLERRKWKRITMVAMKKKGSSTQAPSSPFSIWRPIDQFRYIKIQPNTIDLKFLLFYTVYGKLINIVYRNAEIKNTNKLAREKQYLIM